jgi:hypothetical protein
MRLDRRQARPRAGNANVKRLVVTCLVVAAALLLATGACAAAGASPAWVPGELIVKFKSGVPATQKSALVRGRQVRAFRLIGAEHWKLDDDKSVAATAAALMTDPRVEYAEPNYLLYKLDTPNDALFGELWGLHNTGQTIGGVAGVPDADIDAVEAWDIATGSSSVVVAVIDTGIDVAHPDLAANIWTNPGEIAGNNLDDDGNGFIDDLHGWDFLEGDNEPTDDNSHGTHCAGTIGAVAGNGVGVAGVAWNVQLMALKFQSAAGTGSTVDAIACIEYATSMGVDVMSNSWGNTAYSSALEAAIRAASDADIFFVAAAGNLGADNDVTPFYPSSYDVANVISVMATDNRDRPADDSAWATNYGASTVDIAAPGMRIWSTIRNNSYMYLSGTSMAAPYVSGALALLRARFPDISVAGGRFLLLNVGNDPLPSLAGLCVSGARLNLRRLIADPDTNPPATITDLAVDTVASNWLTLEWTAPVDDGTVVEYVMRSARAPIVDQAGWDAATPVADAPEPAPAGTPVTMRVNALSAGTTYWFGVRARDEYGNLGDLSNSPPGVTLGAPTIAVAPSSLSAALPAGGAAARTLTITNTGPGVVDFTIPRLRQAAPAEVPLPPQHAEKSIAGTAGTAGTGGPDAFGYDWIDSDAAGGPAFNWVDISATGTPVMLNGDWNRGPFEMGFTFPWYGGEYSTFYIGTHGCVSLTAPWTSAVNAVLPSVDAPENLLALLWDQMTTGVGNCHYHSDGNRLIVQYTGVDNDGAGGPYTMQMHLYASGIVEYHYLSLVSPASQATIGIQNGTHNDGLTVAFNDAFAHDNLAIRFTPPPSWLAVHPDSGSLAAGVSVDVEVVFDSAGLCGSRFVGNLHVLSNDPLFPDVVVPVDLAVAGTPDIALDPASLSFGALRVGDSATHNLAVSNRSCSDLTVQGLDFDDPGFTSTQTLPLVIAAGATADLSVVFSPLATGPVNGLLSLASDDPDTPTLVVPLAGTGLDAPDISVSPASLDAAPAAGGTVTRQLTITNNGLANLDFAIPAFGFIDQGAKDAGGPDTFGYRWTDSEDPLGPEFDWVEIMTYGTAIPFMYDNQNFGPFDIGFSFPFYGNEFTTFHVCTNGWISFTNTSTVYSPTTLPNANAPENMIAPFWDDLTFAVYGDAYYHYDGQRLIVEYQSVPNRGSGGFCWFQLRLYPSGRIEFLYKEMTVSTSRATVGIQNATRTDGLTVVANLSDYVHGDLAVRLEANPPWLSVTPNSGHLAAGESAVVTVGIDATGLCGDTYLADLPVRSNDPDSPEVVVPVTLTAQSAADARLSATSLAFGDVYMPNSAVRTESVINFGCAPLQISGLSIDNPVFTASLAQPAIVPTGARQAIDVTFTPVAAGTATGTLSLTTNNPHSPILTVPLSGVGIGNPAIVVTPDTVAITVQPTSQRTIMVHLENPGEGPLIWTAATPDFYDKDAATTGRAGGADEPVMTPLGTGGPDAGGYRWIDSNAVGGPTFSWIDISTTGTAVLGAGDDVVSASVPLGFAFRFYDSSFNRIRICSNGFASFTSTSTTATNVDLPSVNAPFGLLAPFWDNLTLDMAGAGDVRYKNVGGNFVVQWDHVMRAYVLAPLTFEMILTPAGMITFQYLSLGSAVLTSATVGIQDPFGIVGLQVVSNAPYLQENLAVTFWRLPSWVSVSPGSGTVLAGGSANVAITCKATGMPTGLHHAQVRIISNDPVRPTVAVPIAMNVMDYVSEVPGLPAALVLSQNVPNPFNPETKISFALPAAGAVALRVYDVRGAVVRTLVAGELEPGYHEYLWDGRSDAGGQVPSGVYFYRLRTAEGDHTRSMTLVK